MQNNNSSIDDRHATLERTLIDEFLGGRGFTRHTVNDLPAAEATTILRAASAYASLRLADIESKAHYAAEIHHSS
jgi:hypothetical protein